MQKPRDIIIRKLLKVCHRQNYINIVYKINAQTQSSYGLPEWVREQESEYITAAKMMKGEDNPAEEDYGDYPMRRFIEGNNKSLGFEELIINLCNDEKRRCSNPPNIF